MNTKPEKGEKTANLENINTSWRETFSKFWAKQTHLLLMHPLCPTAITFLVLVAGIIGSVWTDEIRKSFPFHYEFKNWNWSWHSFTFWICALFSATLFFFRQRADDQERTLAQKRLLERTGDLEQLIRTLPPANFLAMFSQLYNVTFQIQELAFGGANAVQEKPVLAECIRVVIRQIATLAQKFDGDHPDVRYAANVMIFKSVASLDSAEKRSEIKKIMHLCEEDISVENLKGVLDLDTDLSTVASDNSSKPDPEIKRFALPIPVIQKTGERYRVLPGAPLAFVDRELDMYSDTFDLRKWCDEYGDFTEAVKTKLDTYFRGNGKVIRSFVSIPIFMSPQEEKNNDPIAILNIHSNKIGLLKEGGEPVKHFVAVVRPMQLLLGKLLLSYLK